MGSCVLHAGSLCGLVEEGQPDRPAALHSDRAYLIVSAACQQLSLYKPNPKTTKHPSGELSSSMMRQQPACGANSGAEKMGSITGRRGGTDAGARTSQSMVLIPRLDESSLSRLWMARLLVSSGTMNSEEGLCIRLALVSQCSSRPSSPQVKRC